MPNIKEYRDRLQDKIREANVADKVLEGPWLNVIIKDLNQMSYDYAHEYGVEENMVVDKGAYKISYEEWSHGRLIALNLIISYWLGFESPIHELWDGLDSIQQAYNKGLDEFIQSDQGKKWLQEDKGKKWLQSPQGKEWRQREERLQQQQ